jgi:hypothetical protein
MQIRTANRTTGDAHNHIILRGEFWIRYGLKRDTTDILEDHGLHAHTFIYRYDSSLINAEKDA